MKIEIEFEKDYETDKPILIHLGRLQIGNHIGRLVFTPEGNQRLVISEAAKEDGSILFVEEHQFMGFK